MVDVKRLVEDGHIDLEDVFKDAVCASNEAVNSFTSYCYGPEGDSPGTVNVKIRTLEAYGLTAYRCEEDDGAERSDVGDIFLTREEAEAFAEDYAWDNEEEP